MSRLAVVAALLPASTASAESLQLDDFRPAMDARGYLTLNGAQVLGDRELSFGLGSLEWGRHLLSSTAMSVDNMVSATLVGALGLRVGPVPFEVGASLPFTLVNGSQDAQGVGDLGLHLKARLAHAGPVNLGALASVYVPSSSSREPFLGERSVTPQAIALADVSLGRLRLAINGGIRLRQTTTMAMITTATDVPVGIAAAYAVVPDKIELVGEVFGAVPLAAQQGYQPLEALAGVKVYMAKNSYLSLGAGRGLLPDQAGNPDFRGVVSIVFEPKPAQRVVTELPDEVVVTAPPKQDDLDRDNDYIADRLDHCPDDAENYNGYNDDDGCPERIIDKRSEIVPLEPIEFEFDKAIIRPSSYSILDVVVGFLADNPGVQLVEVQGHTDEQGDDTYNFDLSNRRATAVVAYLTAHGIAPERVEAQGYGETQPVDKSHTQAAYVKNRRVAFIVKTREGL